MNKDQEGVLRRFLDTIFEISNQEFQERVWLKGLGPEYSDFDDAICDFFDNGEDIMINYKNYNISDNQFKKINILKNIIKKYCDKIPVRAHTKDILSDPDWFEIRKMAKDVLKVFDYKKT